MKYVVFIGSDGLPVPEALAVMQRELPAWIEEMDGRGVRLLGRELDLPQTAVTVRVRGGETLVTDGPFAETKEFVAGLDIFECAGLGEAIEAAAKSPVSRYHPMEIRPFAEGLRLGEAASAFAREDDSAGTPYLLTMWMGGTPAAPLDDEAVMQEGEAWRQDLEARGLQVLGNALEGPDTAAVRGPCLSRQRRPSSGVLTSRRDRSGSGFGCGWLPAWRARQPVATFVTSAGWPGGPGSVTGARVISRCPAASPASWSSPR